MSNPTAAAEYVLGADPVELDRLGLQHRLWADDAHIAWRSAGITRGSTVLDVGCGPGFAAVDLAQLVGTAGRVLGVDEASPFIDYTNARAHTGALTQLQAVLGDVQDLPGVTEPGAFDAAWMRWVLCFVARPADVLAGIARALRPGGRLAIHDYFNYESMTLAPRGAMKTKIVGAVARSWRDRGGDPDIMSRVPAMLDDAGMEVVGFRVLQRAARPGDPMWAWPDTFFRGFVPKLVAGGYLNQQDLDGYLVEWEAASGNPHSWMHLPTVYEIIAQKRG